MDEKWAKTSNTTTLLFRENAHQTFQDKCMMMTSSLISKLMA